MEDDENIEDIPSHVDIVKQGSLSDESEPEIEPNRFKMLRIDSDLNLKTHLKRAKTVSSSSSESIEAIPEGIPRKVSFDHFTREYSVENFNKNGVENFDDRPDADFINIASALTAGILTKSVGIVQGALVEEVNVFREESMLEQGRTARPSSAKSQDQSGRESSSEVISVEKSSLPSEVTDGGNIGRVENSLQNAAEVSLGKSGILILAKKLWRKSVVYYCKNIPYEILVRDRNFGEKSKFRPKHLIKFYHSKLPRQTILNSGHR